VTPDSGEGGREERPTFLSQLHDRWRRLGPGKRKVIRGVLLLVLICLALFGVATFIASLTWKGNVSRQAIMVTAILLMGIAALLLLGAGGWKAFVAVAGAIIALGAVAGATIHADSILPDGPPPHGALVGCPGLPKPAAGQEYIYGTVAKTEFGYAHLREQASLQTSPIDLRYPTGCELAFSGWCVGGAKSDWRFHVPDPVWLKHVGAPGYVASADLNIGSPPKGLKTSCPSDKPLPRKPEITSPLNQSLSGPVEFTAADPGAVMVGFAAYYENVPGRATSARWHPLGLDTDVRDGIAARWDTRSIPGQSQRLTSTVVVAAVPCLGLEFPSESSSRRSYVVAHNGGHQSVQLRPTSQSRGSARRLACANAER
jgi:hypothetical protein